MHLLRSVFTGLKIEKKHLSGYKYRTKQMWGGDFQAKSIFKVARLDLNDELCVIEIVIDSLRLIPILLSHSELKLEARTGWNPPIFSERYFMQKPDFVDLFILDGEKAREMNRRHWWKSC